jgi:hypothetical protein
MSRPIHFEYQKFKNLTVVALDSKLSDYGFQPVMENGKLVVKSPEKTVKDCRNIDGCVYFHLGHVSDSVMVDLIEKFNKLKKEKGWKQQQGLIVPDHKFKFD